MTLVVNSLYRQKATQYTYTYMYVYVNVNVYVYQYVYVYEYVFQRCKPISQFDKVLV